MAGMPRISVESRNPADIRLGGREGPDVAISVEFDYDEWPRAHAALQRVFADVLHQMNKVSPIGWSTTDPKDNS